MVPRSEAARGLEFARDAPERAVVQIQVDGDWQAHSWNLRTGSVVTATDGAATAARISPDGQWLWWFDDATQLWWRTPFGSSPRGRRERPLRLHPSPDVDVAVGGDGTALVSRPAPTTGRLLSLLPVGRVRAGAEPAFLGSFSGIRSFHRSLDDGLLAVDTGEEIYVCSAYTGQVISVERTGGEWAAAGFAADGAVVLTRARAGEDRDTAPVIGAQLWHPRSALRRTLPFGEVHHARLTLAYRGAGALLEAWEPAETGSADGGRVCVYSLAFDGSLPTRIGPTIGSIQSGSAVGGPGGAAYAIWHAPDAPARLVNLTKSEANLDPAASAHRQYRPVVGGYGDEGPGR